MKRFTIPELNAVPKFIPEIVAADTQDMKLTPAWLVAKKLGLTALGLSKLTSSLMVESANSKKINFGLNLKYESRKLKVLGYSEKRDTNWEFSNKAIELIQSYLKRFPSILKTLKRPPSGDYYSVGDFFPGNNSDKCVEDLMKWLKENGVRDLITVPLSTTALSVPAVSALSTKLDSYFDELKNASSEEILVKGVPRTHLLKPSHAIFRLIDQNFNLGDRVLFTLEQGFIPFGAHGTVIGIEGPMLEILYDKPVIGGSTLGGRCKEGCGVVSHNFGILNLSWLQPPDSAKAPRKELPKVNNAPRINSQSPKTNSWKTQSSKVKEPPKPQNRKPTPNGNPLVKEKRPLQEPVPTHIGGVPQNVPVMVPLYPPPYGYGYPVPIANPNIQQQQFLPEPSEMLKDMLHIGGPPSVPATPAVSNSFLNFLDSTQNGPKGGSTDAQKQ